MKRLFLETIKCLEENFNTPRKETSTEKDLVNITFFSGYKPSGYFVPQMVFSTKQALEEPTERPMAYYVEIFWNGICIFREYWTDESKTTEELEDIVLRRLYKSIIMNGLFHAKETIFNLYGERSNPW